MTWLVAGVVVVGTAAVVAVATLYHGVGDDFVDKSEREVRLGRLPNPDSDRFYS
jgi:hypothetical protein